MNLKKYEASLWFACIEQYSKAEKLCREMKNLRNLKISLSVGKGKNTFRLKTHREFTAHRHGIATAMTIYRQLPWLNFHVFTDIIDGHTQLGNAIRPSMRDVRAMLCDEMEVTRINTLKNQYLMTPRQDVAFSMGICAAMSVYEDLLLVNNEVAHEQ
ncbi:MAG: hypothetical protein ACQEWL_07900 [Pseudomonadota bacterium]|uniref:Uncharacterized protein n=1 Tax=Providencia stuartii TaxID=588 RepID=A0A1S1HVD2_PROST|nr:hypothetical protein A3Q29_00305 [Providencia stuartii]